MSTELYFHHSLQENFYVAFLPHDAMLVQYLLWSCVHLSVTSRGTVVVCKKSCNINMLLLHTTNRKCHIACRFMPFSVTLNDLEGHSVVAGLFKYNLTIICTSFACFQLTWCIMWSLGNS